MSQLGHSVIRRCRPDVAYRERKATAELQLKKELRRAQRQLKKQARMLASAGLQA